MSEKRHERSDIDSRKCLILVAVTFRYMGGSGVEILFVSIGCGDVATTIDDTWQHYMLKYDLWWEMYMDRDSNKYNTSEQARTPAGTGRVWFFLWPTAIRLLRRLIQLHRLPSDFRRPGMGVN